MAKDTAKILVQNPCKPMNMLGICPPPRHQQRCMKADRPIVNAGKMMWAQTVKAHCRRENKTGSGIVIGCDGGECTLA